MSPPENNDWITSATVGSVLGFTVFGSAYVFSVIKIFIDINQRDKMYTDDIEEDLKTIRSLGLDSKMDEIQKELDIRLSGGKADDGGDDQLIETAKALSEDQYKKYM